MNRRELLAAFSSAVAVAGVDATVDLRTVTDPKRSLVVIRCTRRISSEAASRLSEHWRAVMSGTEWERTPVIVLDEEMSLEVKERP